MVVSGRDRFLNAILSGGAPLVAKLRTFSAAEAGAEPREAIMEAHDRGNGSYTVDCSLKQACDFEVCFLTQYSSSGISYVMIRTHSLHPRASRDYQASCEDKMPGLNKRQNASKGVPKV